MILVAVLLADLVRAFALQPFWIPSSSMTPTLGVYDRIVVQKAFFSWRDVREGDIVVFSHRRGASTGRSRSPPWLSAAARAPPSSSAPSPGCIRPSPAEALRTV